jgi:two-component system OmpR family response regulator
MMQTLNSARIDLIVLDILMPGEDGLSLCRRLRNSGRMPIIMLTAVGGEVDRIVGLELGADDYLPKPFNPRELLARIRAVLRRSHLLDNHVASSQRIFEFGRWRLDASRRRLVARNTGAFIDLRPAEFGLLLALVEHPRRTLTRDQLLDLVWGSDIGNFDRSVDVYVSRVRRRIEVDPKEPDLIKTVRGAGYVFAAPITLNGAPW